MNPRRPLMWWVFWVGAALVIAALAWASLSVARLERRNESNRLLAQRQEVIRLALWRLDSRLAPIIAAEAARPPAADDETYRLGVYSALPMQLNNAFVEGFFTVDAASNVTASDPRNRAIAERVATPESRAGLAMQPAPADASAGQSAAEEASQPAAQQATQFDYAARQQIAEVPQRADPVASKSAAREQFRAASPAATLADRATALDADQPEPSPAARLEPQWVATAPERVDLVLVRTVPTAEGPLTEGVTMDWAALRRSLEESISDLLPEALLVPARGPAAARIEVEGRGFRLATVPALLIPGDFTPALPFRMTPALWALVITWVAAVGALAAVGLVLRATMRLSDRRARFVGAVTHELRTPLTTFRLYAQMLAGGMVSDEKARAEYLGTLERESVRLGEIVENVLEYARLTRRRPGGARPPGERSVSPSELLARVRPPLSRRAEQSGMDLIVSVDPSVEAEPRRSVTCDPRSVERILMNLVENACKYALPDGDPDEEDTRIHLDLARGDRHLEILVADHGRGIPRRDRERVFGEFQRGPGAADGSRPGLGLGLALSRGLAREMGGDLRLVRRRGHGAEFLLTIPLDPAPEDPPRHAGAKP